MKRHLAILGLVVGLSVAIQAWMVRHAVVPSQDCVRYVAMAQAMDRHGWAETVRGESEHPLFPTLVWLTQDGLEACVGNSKSIWAHSAQLAAAVPLVLAVVPVYFLLLRMAGNPAALFGALLFCVLNDAARLGADGLSDSTHLLLACLALWGIAEWLASPAGGRASRTKCQNTVWFRREPSVSPVANHADGCIPSYVWLLAAGVAMGAALLARAEAVLLVPAVALAAVMFQCSKSLRLPRLVLCRDIAAVAVGIALVWAPYLALVQATTPHSALARVLGRGDGAASIDPAAPATDIGPDTADWLLASQPMSFRAKENAVTSRFHGYSAATVEYGKEVTSLFQGWIGLLALVGFWAGRWRAWRRVDYLSVALFLTVSLATVHYAATAGYLASRHLLILLAPGLGYAGLGICCLGNAVARARLWDSWASRTKRPERISNVEQGISNIEGKRSFAVAWAMLTVAVMACLPATLAPLHASRAAHRRAAEWLAAADPPGSVLDTRGWTGLYSGRGTYRYDAARRAFGSSRLTYVVVLQEELEYDSPRSYTLRRLLAMAGERAAVFAAPDGQAGHAVAVYRWRPRRLAEHHAFALQPH